MLLGDLITAVSHDLPVKLVVFDNGRLGMVKLEMEQVGLPEFGTVLHNPDFARVAEAVGMNGIRVEQPRRRRGSHQGRPRPRRPGCSWTVSPTPTRSPSHPSPPSSRAGASRSPRPANSSTAPIERSSADPATRSHQIAHRATVQHPLPGELRRRLVSGCRPLRRAHWGFCRLWWCRRPGSRSAPRRYAARIAVHPNGSVAQVSITASPARDERKRIPMLIGRAVIATSPLSAQRSSHRASRELLDAGHQTLTGPCPRLPIRGVARERFRRDAVRESF